eukprot:6651745-Prymnesium_polylepis.1
MRAVAFLTLEGSASIAPTLTSSPAFEPSGGIPGETFADASFDLRQVRPAAGATEGPRWPPRTRVLGPQNDRGARARAPLCGGASPEAQRTQRPARDPRPPR